MLSKLSDRLLPTSIHSRLPPPHHTLEIRSIRQVPWQCVPSFLVLSKVPDRLCPTLPQPEPLFPSTSTTGIMAEMLSKELFVSQVHATASRQTSAVLASAGVDPVKDQEPAPLLDLSRSSQSLQQWEVTTVDVLRARQQVQGSRATTIPICHELESPPKQVVDRRTFKQISSEEVQHPVAQPPSGSHGTKRKSELGLEPPTSKHAREHTTPKQPQQSTSQTSKHDDQSNISQKTADDIEHLRSKHKPAMAQDHTRLVEAPQPNITALHATLATPPKTSASTTLPIPPIVLGKSNLIRDNLLFLPDGAYFLHLSRVKRALENAMDSDEGVAWITRYPEAPRMASKINEVLEDMSHCVKRSELDFGAREWVVWRSLDRAVERRRMEELRKPR